LRQHAGRLSTSDQMMAESCIESLLRIGENIRLPVGLSNNGTGPDTRIFCSTKKRQPVVVGGY
jgi:hypothetical protein